MLKRIITSVVAAVCLLVPAIIFSHTVVLPIAIAICAAISIFEMLKCMGVHKKYIVSVPLYLIAVAAPFAVRYIESGAVTASVCFVVAIAYLIFTFACVIWSHGKYTFADGMSVFCICGYIIAAFCSIIYVRDFDDGGGFIFILIFLGAWMTDIFAYFTGKLFGKHKLIPDVSPKKTIEGSIGGIVFCTISFVLYALVIDAVFDMYIRLTFLIVSGVLVSIVSQIGDLIMSVIKRHYGIKDYGKIFPGHGGMLDRFDSVLIVSLCMFAICLVAKLLGYDFISALT